MMIENVTIAGLGALGGLFADKLTAAGIAVTAVADPARVARYKAEGITANGRRLQVAYKTPEEAQPADLLIFAAKYTALAQAIEEARTSCGPDTIVMSLLNGVISEEDIAAKLAPAHLLYTTAQGMATGKVGNKITYYSDGSLTFGTRKGQENADTAAVAALLDRVGYPYQIAPDMMRRLYSKWMLNCGVNQTCAVYKVGYGGVQPSGPYRDKMIAAMEEARQVAIAAGYPLSVEERDAWVRVIDGLDPQGEPSMRQDAKAGRPTEVALFGQTVCRLGRTHGIATPINEAYTAILRGQAHDA